LEFWPHKDRAPVAAKVGLIRSTFDEPVWAVAMYDEYVATKPVWKNGQKTGQVEITAQWKPAAQGGKPSVMLAKVAEAQAWRVTFPERFGGFYAPEEFEKDRVAQHADNPAAEKRKAAFAAAQAAESTAPADVVDAQIVDEPDQPGRQFGDAERALLFADVHRIRPYVLDALREQKRDDEAARYEQAPPAGTCEELFGRGPVVVDPPAETVDQAETPGEESAK
jgi:hypothetical protein